ncbi:uncharacterized protein BO80DRAFT_444066 [Aspergillus ibericus CBS 121593]|uniref:Uncharacterized protein n=1 Tax=Aspergillus ibericus CBS 121593 TaxID=1448316 RepID=A0A395H3G5_9EURO|nr:hypothetical protein BO80DRAFT_444066 [Aspergillus ibericus CBS 121593]RAL02276.1 hypothetical protein BO80DRAFT_444066 [Aspergillus ibericus CBS 121593]
MRGDWNDGHGPSGPRLRSRKTADALRVGGGWRSSNLPFRWQTPQVHVDDSKGLPITNLFVLETLWPGATRIYTDGSGINAQAVPTDMAEALSERHVRRTARFVLATGRLTYLSDNASAMSVGTA